MKVRRVVTGHTPDGKATIASDMEVDGIEFPIEAAVREVENKFPGLLAHVEPNTPGIHTTNTIDFEYVLSGEVWLELDDDVKVHLRAGDTVVQNGTRHRWYNNGSEPCRMVLCMIGTQRK